MDVDIVVLWVDGSDPNWLKEKNLKSIYLRTALFSKLNIEICV